MRASWFPIALGAVKDSRASVTGNVVIVAYYEVTPDDPMVAAGIVQLNGVYYRCERYDREEDWLLATRLA